MSDALGAADIRRMQKAGWAFEGSGWKVGNGYMVWATNPQGNLVLKLLADPEQEPEKWPEEPDANPMHPNQMELFK